MFLKNFLINEHDKTCEISESQYFESLKIINGKFDRLNDLINNIVLKTDNHEVNLKISNDWIDDLTTSRAFHQI